MMAIRGVLLLYHCLFLSHVTMAPGTAPDVGLLHSAHVRNLLQLQPLTWIWVINTGLAVKLADTMVTGIGVVAHTLKWDWEPGHGRGYENETYHVRVKGEGNERWLEVFNQVPTRKQFSSVNMCTGSW